MKNVKKFIKNEKNKEIETYSTIKNNIHLINIDINVIDKKIKLIRNGIDNTVDIFLSHNINTEFSSKEIEKLIATKVDLLQKKEILLVELDESQKKVDDINKAYTSIDNPDFIVNNLSFLSAQEADRQRIARDIHDSVVQNMSAIIYKLEFINNIVDSDVQRTHIEIKNCTSIIKESIDDLRNIIFNLRPMSLDDLGFKKTFLYLMTNLNNLSDIDIKYTFKGDDTNISPVISINIIRIINEICSNSIKYSCGTEIILDINIDNKCLLINQKDNGVGFDAYEYLNSIKSDKSIVNKSGFGLSMLKDRVKLLGGEISFESNDKYTGYKIIIPISEVQ